MRYDRKTAVEKIRTLQNLHPTREFSLELYEEVMKMETYYLGTGEEVILHHVLSETQNVVERLVEFTDLQGVVKVEPSGKQEVVGVVYTKPPMNRMHQEYARLQVAIDSRNVRLHRRNRALEEVAKKLGDARRELKKVQDTRTDLSRLIINRQELLEADTITYFSRYRPYTLSTEAEKRNLRIAFSYKVLDGKSEGWEYKVNQYGSDSDWESIDQTYGLMVNATEQDILDAGKDLVASAGSIPDILLSYLPDEYLTPELKVRKEKLAKKQKAKAIERYEGEIAKAQENLDRLRNQ